MTRVKICCIASLEEMRMAAEAGAHAIGLVSAMPSGPGVIDEASIAEIASRVPADMASFLLTSLTDTAEIARQARRLGTDTVQLVDRLETGTHSDLRRELPGVAIVQVIHVLGDESVDDALATESEVDALLLDSGNPALATKELGGTGRTHDWSVSRRIVERAKVPVFLAGGLAPHNVAEAIRAVRPWGVDLCSGIRTDGNLDAVKLRDFMAAVRDADS